MESCYLVPLAQRIVEGTQVVFVADERDGLTPFLGDAEVVMRTDGDSAFVGGREAIAISCEEIAKYATLIWRAAETQDVGAVVEMKREFILMFLKKIAHRYGW